MKICILMSRIANGGLERVQINLANEFLAAGHEVDIVTGKVLFSPYPSLDMRARLVEIAPRGSWQFTVGLASYMLRSKPDCILTTSNDIACMALLLRAILAPRIKIVVTQHLSLSTPLEQSRGISRPKQWLLFKAMRILLPFSDSTIAVSKGVASDLARVVSLPIDAISVIYNPIITNNFESLSEEQIDWPWADQDVPVVVFVGRLSPEKRLDLLLSSLLPSLKSGQSRLLVVGSGPQSDWLLSQIRLHRLEAACALTGFVQNVLPYIKRSKVLVLPSDYEGFGNVLVEGMGCGIQVVSTDCPHGPREVLAEGQFGQLVPVGNSSAMREAILNSIHGSFHVAPQALMERASEFTTQKAASSYMKVLGGWDGRAKVH
jgi:glycosyltransferase involved in cell wall biosynthesis